MILHTWSQWSGLLGILIFAGLAVWGATWLVLEIPRRRRRRR